MNHYLLIDDEDVFNFIHRQIISGADHGARITEAIAAQDALDLILRHSKNPDELPDFILVDISMPEINGFEFLSRITQLMPDLAKKPLIYMVTSSLFESDRKSATAFPVLTGFIEKPIVTDQILAMIKAKQG